MKAKKLGKARPMSAKEMSVQEALDQLLKALKLRERSSNEAGDARTLCACLADAAECAEVLTRQGNEDVIAYHESGFVEELKLAHFFAKLLDGEEEAIRCAGED